MGGPQKPGVMKTLGSSFVESKLVAFLSSLKHEEVLCKQMILFEFRLRKKTSFWMDVHGSHYSAPLEPSLRKKFNSNPF